MTAVLRPRTRTYSLFLYSFFRLSYFRFPPRPQLSAAESSIPTAAPSRTPKSIVTGIAAAPLRARSDGDGRFVFTGLDAGHYRISASAPGLVSDATAVDVTSSPATVDISLHLSAIAETLVVSAAQIDQPLSRTPDSVTVIPGAEIDAKQQFTLASALRSVPGRHAAAERRSRHRHVALHARRRIRLHARLGRRRSRELVRRRPRSLAGSAAGCRSHRGAAWTAERALRIGRHRRRDPRHHAQRRISRRHTRRSKPAAATCGAQPARPPAK